MRAPHFVLFGFPVRFEPVFLLLVAFLAFNGQSDLFFTISWIVIITVSVLVHELGHAFAYRHYGATPSISLHGLGGLTYGHNSEHLNAKQRIVVSAAGSTTTMVLFGGPAWLALQSLDLTGDARSIVNAIFFINVIWALVNLAPVFPLDGGHIMDDGLLLLTGRSQRRLVNWISLGIAVAIGGYFFIAYQSIFALFIFGYMAFINITQLGIVGGGQGDRPQRPRVEDVLSPPPAGPPVQTGLATPNPTSPPTAAPPTPPPGSPWDPPRSDG